jgi:hypothetical protein
MPRHSELTKCSICGEVGLATQRDALSWFGVQHADPSICADVLKRRVQTLEALIAELKAETRTAKEEVAGFRALYGSGELRSCRL